MISWNSYHKMECL